MVCPFSMLEISVYNMVVYRGIALWYEGCEERLNTLLRVICQHSKQSCRLDIVPQIPGDTQQGSLLAAGLAAVKISASQPGQAGTHGGARQRDDTLSDGESLIGDPRVDHSTEHGPGGCTVRQE